AVALTTELEAAGDPTEAGECACNGVERNAELEGDGRRAGRVRRDLHAERNRELAGARAVDFEREPAAARLTHLVDDAVVRAGRRPVSPYPRTRRGETGGDFVVGAQHDPS